MHEDAGFEEDAGHWGELAEMPTEGPAEDDDVFGHGDDLGPAAYGDEDFDDPPVQTPAKKAKVDGDGEDLAPSTSAGEPCVRLEAASLMG